MSLQPLPSSFAATRADLHRLAEQVVSPARRPHNEIALQATPGGWGTPPFEWEGAVQQVRVDCDRDTVLLQCIPDGPTCHTGAQSCFDPAGQSASGPAVLAPGESDAEAVEPGDGAAPLNRREAVEPEDGAAPLNRPEAEVGAFLAELEQVVVTRDRERPEGSYTTSLLEGGVRRVAQKVGEEGGETALAAVAQEDPELIGESADLLYHLLVLLRSRDLGLADVEAELRRRHG